MKVKRIALLLLIVSLAGAGTVFADSVYEHYLAKKTTVNVNLSKLDTTGLSVDISKEQQDVAMASINDVVSSIGGIISYNKKDNIVDIFKPNVQLSVFQKDNKNPFGRVTKGDKYSFYIFAQVDSLLVDITSIKFVIKDPFGTEVSSEERTIKKSQENFYAVSEDVKIQFKYSGKYTVNMYMKADGNSKYDLVSQLGIYSEQ